MRWDSYLFYYHKFNVSYLKKLKKFNKNLAPCQKQLECHQDTSSTYLK